MSDCVAPFDPPSATEPLLLGRNFAGALRFIFDLHRRDERKGSTVPYIGHLLGVCSLVLEEGGSEDQSIAALLHDAAEDHGGERMLAQIREDFGAPVAEIVRACSDSLLPEGEEKQDWRPRKEAFLQHLEKDTAEPALLVSLADKLLNARAILRDYKHDREELWPRFSTGKDDPDAGREDQLWYYERLNKIFSERMPTVRMAQELADVVGQLEALIRERTGKAPAAPGRAGVKGKA